MAEHGWTCQHCGSTKVNVAVEWCDTVEPVDTLDRDLGPRTCHGETNRLLDAACTVCHAEGVPATVLEWTQLTNTQIAEAHDG